MQERYLFVALLKACVLLSFATDAAAQPDNIEICGNCHAEDATGDEYANVPIIAGIPAAHLEEAMFAYKDGARRCVELPRMCTIMASLTDDEIIAFADYFADFERPESVESFDAGLAAKGEQLHEEHCAVCHVPPDADNVGEALGIPLHAQRSGYLRLALDAYREGDRETLIPAMADRLELIDDEDTEALVHYYASYRR